MNTPSPLPPDGQMTSPCIGICRLDAGLLCIGCRRSGREIAEWPYASEARRLEILKQLARRPAATAPTSG